MEQESQKAYSDVHNESYLEKLGLNLGLTLPFWIALGTFFLSFSGVIAFWYIAKNLINPNYILAFGTSLSFILFWITYAISASYAKIAKESIQYQKDINKQEVRIKTLSDLQNYKTSLDEIFKIAAKGGLLAYDADIGIISRVEGNELTILASASSDPSHNAQDIGKACYSISLYATEVVAINQMGGSIFKDHPCYKSFKVEGYIGSSILVENKRYGTINFFKMKPYDFSDADRVFLELLSSFIGSAIEKDLWEKKVKSNTEEVELLNKIKIGRELRMIELKREIALLKSKISGPKKESKKTAKT